MTGPDAPASPIETAAGAVGPAATAAFKRLANETRLAILLAFWELRDPFGDDGPVPFSVLRRRVGMRDKGKFHYHLDKLEGHFVRRTDEGYELRRAGLAVVQTVIAGTGIHDYSLERTEIDQSCYLCGGSTVVAHHEEMLHWICTECEGIVYTDRIPSGTLGAVEFDPAGFTDRSPAEALNAGVTGNLLQHGLGGVCDACSGPMDGWLTVCGDHDAGGVCAACGWRDPAVARFRCAVCKHNHQIVAWYLLLEHPAVVSFYYDRDVALLWEDGVDGQARVAVDLYTHQDHELLSVDPPRVRVTVSYEGDELRLTLDESLDVQDVRLPG